MKGKRPENVNHLGARRIQHRSTLRLDERGRQVIRFIDILRALENSRSGLTVKQLTEQLELDCDPRTVYRDLEHIERAGFSLIEKGARYRVDGPSIKSDPLTDSQMLAVVLAADALSSMSGFGIERELVTLRDSLRARLSPQRRKWLDVLRGLVAVKRRGPRLRLPAGAMEAIESSLITEQVLEIDYAPPNRSPELRILEPHLLWCHAEREYLVAWCRKANAFRNFLLVRIQSARVLDETFERRESFDAEEHVARGFGAYHGPSMEVALRFSSEVAHLTDERTFHPTQKVEPQNDGSKIVQFTSGGLPEIAAWVVSFGGKVRVLGPPELREAVRQMHEEGLRANAETEETSNKAPLSRKNGNGFHPVTSRVNEEA